MQGTFWVEALGGLAAICITLSFIPQAWRVLRTRDTRAISLTMYVVRSAWRCGWPMAQRSAARR